MNVTTVEVNATTKDRHYLVVKVNVSDVHYYILVKVTWSQFFLIIAPPLKNRHVHNVCCIYFNNNAAYMQIAHKREMSRRRAEDFFFFFFGGGGGM